MKKKHEKRALVVEPCCWRDRRSKDVREEDDCRDASISINNQEQNSFCYTNFNHINIGRHADSDQASGVTGHLEKGLKEKFYHRKASQRKMKRIFYP